jgi:hypothetical protein
VRKDREFVADARQQKFSKRQQLIWCRFRFGRVEHIFAKMQCWFWKEKLPPRMCQRMQMGIRVGMALRVLNERVFNGLLDLQPFLLEGIIQSKRFVAHDTIGYLNQKPSMRLSLGER